jgi:hypothetical protein
MDVKGDVRTRLCSLYQRPELTTYYVGVLPQEAKALARGKVIA